MELLLGISTSLTNHGASGARTLNFQIMLDSRFQRFVDSLFLHDFKQNVLKSINVNFRVFECYYSALLLLDGGMINMGHGRTFLGFV